MSSESSDSYDFFDLGSKANVNTEIQISFDEGDESPAPPAVSPVEENQAEKRSKKSTTEVFPPAKRLKRAEEAPGPKKAPPVVISIDDSSSIDHSSSKSEEPPPVTQAQRNAVRHLPQSRLMKEKTGELLSRVQRFNIDYDDEEPVLPSNRARIIFSAKGYPELPIHCDMDRPLSSAIEPYLRSLAPIYKEVTHVQVDSIPYPITNTPRELNLVSGDVIILTLPQAPPEPEPSNDASAKSVLLELQDSKGNHFKFKINATHTFSKLISAFAEKANIPLASISHLEFDGEKLKPNSTPEEFEMEDDFAIDVKLKK